ncbi:hypothetical protein GCM10027346_38330 [Hymenobacter seoulensis]
MKNVSSRRLRWRLPRWRAALARQPLAAFLRRFAPSRSLTPGSYERLLMGRYAQGELSLSQAEADLNQLITDWELLYRG